MKLCLLDMLPNYHVWTNANMKWGLNTWHWLFMAQPEPFPDLLTAQRPLRQRAEKPELDCAEQRLRTPETQAETQHTIRAQARLIPRLNGM